jgi:hypothetical protein
MFIRVKKIKGQEYAYLVKNEWTPKGTRQIAKQYLGKVCRPNLVNEAEFNVCYNEKNTVKDIVLMLVEWELSKHGFSKNQNKMMKDTIEFDLETLKLTNNKRQTSLAINEGILNEMTINRIITLQSKDFEHETMYELAKAFVESGIKVPKEVFADLYERLA